MNTTQAAMFTATARTLASSPGSSINGRTAASTRAWLAGARELNR